MQLHISKGFFNEFCFGFLIQFKSEAQDITCNLLPILQADFEKEQFFFGHEKSGANFDPDIPRFCVYHRFNCLRLFLCYRKSFLPIFNISSPPYFIYFT